MISNSIMNLSSDEVIPFLFSIGEDWIIGYCSSSQSYEAFFFTDEINPTFSLHSHFRKNEILGGHIVNEKHICFTNAYITFTADTKVENHNLQNIL